MNPSLQRSFMNPLLLTAGCPIFETKLFLVYDEMKSFDRQMTGMLCPRSAAVCNIIKNSGKPKDIESSCQTLSKVMLLCFYTNSWECNSISYQ